LTRERLIEACGQIVEAIRAYDPDIHVCAEAQRSESEGLLVTTGGVRQPTRRTLWSLLCEIQRTRGEQMLLGYAWRSWRDAGAHFDPGWIAEQILESLRLAERRAEPPVGRLPALLPPRIVRQLLKAVELGVNGRNVAKGDSPLAGRLGERVLNPSVTIVDDPHLDYCDGAAVIDGDGVPTRVTPLLTRGVLEGFLYDLDSAGLAGAEPTGNDGCMPWSLRVAPGRR
ncbi:unnamed protein product, partial [marine sediment metagenome]